MFSGGDQLKTPHKGNTLKKTKTNVFGGGVGQKNWPERVEQKQKASSRDEQSRKKNIHQWGGGHTSRGGGEKENLFKAKKHIRTACTRGATTKTVVRDREGKKQSSENPRWQNGSEKNTPDGKKRLDGREGKAERQGENRVPKETKDFRDLGGGKERTNPRKGEWTVSPRNAQTGHAKKKATKKNHTPKGKGSLGQGQSPSGKWEVETDREGKQKTLF